MGGGKVIQIDGRGDWDRYHASAVKEKKLLVADFTATWCGPCKIMAPVFEELSLKYPNAFFLKVDVDNNNDIASELGVRGIPAFHFFKGGNKVDEVVGADQSKLRALVEKLYEAPSFQGQGQKLGSKSDAEASSSVPTPAPQTGSYDESELDHAKPITSIQIRLPDGNRLVGRFNTDASVSKVRAYVATSRPSLPPSFQIMESFPPKPLTNYDVSIKDAGLVNASLQIKL